MENIVKSNYSYSSVRAGTSEKVMSVFERLMEAVEEPHGIEVDNLYSSNNFSEILGSIIPAPTLTALVNRGMLHCDGKVNGKNSYAITEEIYNYYKNTYKPGWDKHEERMSALANKLLTLSVKEN